MPIRTNLKTKFGSSLIMPAYLKESKSLGLKIVGVRTENPKKNLPTVPACICMIDEETGLPNCFMDASELTAIRTAAGCGLATKYLAKNNCSTLGL
jgi:ornithine cyclodeaminase/alanine dehydrogenase-like protein (mu-crystallin family)